MPPYPRIKGWPEVPTLFFGQVIPSTGNPISSEVGIGWQHSKPADGMAMAVALRLMKVALQLMKVVVVVVVSGQ